MDKTRKRTEDICDNCGEKRKNHIDYFGTGKKNVCPHRKSMHFKLNTNGGSFFSSQP